MRSTKNRTRAASASVETFPGQLLLCERRSDDAPCNVAQVRRPVEAIRREYNYLFSVNLLQTGSARGPVTLAVFKTVDRYL